MIEQTNTLDDLTDSQNISFEELFDENLDKGTTFYFYKAKSYIKEQKARIVIEKDAISILCIETDLSNDPYDLESYFNNEEPIKNGFITYGIIQSNNIKLQKLKFNDDSSLEFRELQQPIIEINIPLDFLIDNIYFVSLKDLSENDINEDDLFIIDGTVVDLPNITNKNDIEQVPQNGLSLIPISTYNSSKVSTISVNKVTPISLNNILVDNNKFIFSLNSDLILWSTIQAFINSNSSNINNTNSCKVDIYNKENETVITTKLPIKLSCTNFNSAIQLNNEWKDLLLDWNIARDFLQQQDLENVLTIKNIPNADLVLSKVKIKSIDLKISWQEIISNPLEQNHYTYNKILDNDFHFNSGNSKGWLYQAATSPDSVQVMDNNHNYPNNRSTTWISEDINDNGNIIIILEDGSEQTFTDYKIKDYNQVIIDNRFYQRLNFSQNDINSIPLGSISITGNMSNNTENEFTFYYNNPQQIYDWPINGQSFQQEIMWYLKLNDKNYDFLTLTKPATDDKFILVKFLKKLLKYTVNQRFNFAGALYDDDGNPSNEIAKLKAEFQVQGTNPLQNISNLFSNFLMLNPWLPQIPEWDYLLKCVIMLSQYIYSSYSLNTGDKSPEEIALPYYFKFLTPAIQVGTGDNKIYDYESLQVQLESKYFDFSNYNDLPFNNKIFNKLNTLDSKLTIENQFIKIVYPFLNSSLQETMPVKNPQKYNIEDEDFQRYLMYFITSVNSLDSNGTNKIVFDDYMNSIFLADKNYQHIKKLFEIFSCKTNEQYYSSDNSIIGDLPFSAIFTEDSEDELYSSDNSIIFTIRTDSNNEPLISSDNSIIITKE